MKKILFSAIALALIATACVTKKVQTTNPDGSVTTATVVNEENLAIDASVFQSVVATATALSVQHDPSVVPTLKTAQRAMDDIVNGISQQSVQDVLGKLKAQSNPVVAAQVDSLLKAGSALEQKLVAKYGSTVAGEISLALVKAADGGLIVGLNGK